MRKKNTPSQGTEIVGKKPAWEMWAEAQCKQANRGRDLIAMGAFTASDLAKKNGWTLNRAKHHIRRQDPPLKCEVANDDREYRNPQVRFYFPP
jgi:hypothetical protein